jgi:hypothetical protein
MKEINIIYDLTIGIANNNLPQNQRGYIKEEPWLLP